MLEVNFESLLEKAKSSAFKESYCVLQRTKRYRIGIGARVTPPDVSSFFLETIVGLTDESKMVDLPHLKRVIDTLEILRSKGYMLVYEDDNCISCEISKFSQDLEKEYLFLESLMKTLAKTLP